MAVKPPKASSELLKDVFKEQKEELIREKNKRINENLERTAKDHAFKREETLEKNKQKAVLTGEKLYEHGRKALSEGHSPIDTVASIVEKYASQMILYKDLIEAQQNVFWSSMNMRLLETTPFKYAPAVSQGMAWAGKYLAEIAPYRLGLAKPVYVIPEMKYFLNLSDENKLEYRGLAQCIVRSDGKPLPTSPAAEDEFKATLGAWIEANGCVCDNAGYIYKKNAPQIPDNILKKADFEKLRDDPVTGLGRYLTNKLGLPSLELSEEPEPPSSSMSSRM